MPDASPSPEHPRERPQKRLCACGRTQSDALEIYDALVAEGPSSAAIGRYAAERSTCGSAKKSPDAKLGMLRGAPGELKFRKGAMAPEFEQAAFDAAPGTLVRPFRTQFGWHVMYVRE
jgi:parvulin-like peptidyl-prolyl isomerase